VLKNPVSNNRDHLLGGPSSRGHYGQPRTPPPYSQQGGFLIRPDSYIGWCGRSLPGAELDELSPAGVQLL